MYKGDIEHTHNLENHGLDWSMQGPVFLIGEAVYQVNQKKDDPQYPGNYKLGLWFDGHNYQDFGTQVLGAKGCQPGLRAPREGRQLRFSTACSIRSCSGLQFPGRTNPPEASA